MEDDFKVKIITVSALILILPSFLLVTDLTGFKELNTVIGENQSNLFNKSYSKHQSDRYVKNAFDDSDKWGKEKSSELKWNNYLYDVSRYQNESIREVYLENAWILYSETYEEARRNEWFNLEKAEEDGFNNTYSRDHFVNKEYYRDNETLNPEKPEFLIFRENSSGEKILIGAMYMQNNVEKEGRQAGGPLTKWHYHTFENQRCYHSGYAIRNQTKNCPSKYYSNKSPEMLHVWFIDHLEGTFATNMYASEKTIDSGNDKLNRAEFVEKQKSQLRNYRR